MYFDFEDLRPDITPVGSVISWREGVLLSIIGHLALIIFLLLAPRIFPSTPEDERLAQLELSQAKPPDETRFVFMDPKMDLEALRAPRRAPASDKNREARTPEKAPVPRNTEPLSRGNTPERVEQRQPEAARGRGPQPEAAPPQPSQPEPPQAPAPQEAQPRPDRLRLPDSQSAMAVPPASAPASSSSRITGGGSLGDALRNLERYMTPEQFDNPNGGSAQFGPIQFDSKGVEFGPWIRRFVAQVKRNWEPLIPNGPIMMRQTGHVVVTLNIHKNGTITDVNVVGPSAIQGFNSAAYGALTTSNPTQPLPPEYPVEKAFFTITFYYNERPPDQ